MRRSWLVVVGLLAVLSGCTGTGPAGPEEIAPNPFAACPAATPAPPAAGDLAPDVTLPCFTGGQPVSLRALGKPALINLWASWCGACRKEMPALQAFADQAGDRAIVLGVITGDTRNAAAYAAADFGVSFPSVFDPDQRLLKELGRNGIPITLFVDASGVVRHVDISGALTLDSARALASDHLGLSI